MKKIGKFRKWLIHKLGGVLLEDKPVIIKAINPSITLESTLIKSYYDFQCLCESSPFMVENLIKEELWEKMKKEVLPYIVFTRNDNIEDMTKTFKAKLTIIKGE